MPSPIIVSSALLENGWEEIDAFPILLAAFRKREGPSQKGWGRLIRTAFLCSHSAGSHTCMLGPHCAFCWQVSKANRFCFLLPWYAIDLLVLGRWEKRMTNTDICPPMEMQGGWPKHSSEKEWAGAKTSLHAYALSSRATSMVWRSYATPQQLCLRNANRINAWNEIRKLNLNILFQLNGLTCGSGAGKHPCSLSGA